MYIRQLFVSFICPITSVIIDINYTTHFVNAHQFVSSQV
jgi:hypothetical protein